MRKAAGIILITLGVYFVYFLITGVVAVGIRLLLDVFTPGAGGLVSRVVVLGSVGVAAFYITCGIFCLRRKYWGVCLASALLVVLLSLCDLASGRGWVFSGNIAMGSIPWVVFAAVLIAVIFIGIRKKEWQVISDSVDGKVSYGG
ncbi:MAG: hypothetical protein JSW22_07845 [Chloroflexota bacterium]|nr:MAG: hypothetical protein JSW22_07845 [Chloroflexota bacterium]